MPILSPYSLEVISRSPEQTRRIGMRLGALLKPGDVIGLVGNLGAGKTTLVQGIASGWGSLDQVSSPTFVLINVYRRPEGERLFHLDAYRLSGPEEALDLDLDTMLAVGPIVVEWADKIEDALPNERLWMTMNWVEDHQRDLYLEASGERYEALMKTIRRMIYGG